MTTLIIDIKDSEDAKKIADALRLMKSVTRITVEKDDELELPAGRIPGFPYTDEERRESVRQAMKEIRNGARGYTSDEVRAMIPR